MRRSMAGSALPGKFRHGPEGCSVASFGAAMPKSPKDPHSEEEMVNTGERQIAEASTVETAPVSDENPGATAFVRVEPKPKPPPPEPEPEVEVYRPLPADDYAGHVPSGPPPWQVWLRRAVTLSIVFGVLGLAGVIAGYLYISREI